MGCKFMTGVLIKREIRHREKKDHILMETEMGVTQWEPRNPNCWPPAEARRQGKILP